MITPPEEGFITDHAYVSEHLPAYVQATAGGGPHLLGDCLCLRTGDSLLVNGYPSGSPFGEAALGRAIESAVARFAPRHVALIAEFLESHPVSDEIR